MDDLLRGKQLTISAILSVLSVFKLMDGNISVFFFHTSAIKRRIIQNEVFILLSNLNLHIGLCNILQPYIW